MAKNTFKLNYKGVGELLKSEPMQKILSDYATNIKNRCGDGYEQDIYIGKSRANAMVTATTFQARKDNMDNNTLLKAVR